MPFTMSPMPCFLQHFFKPPTLVLSNLALGRVDSHLSSDHRIIVS